MTGPLISTKDLVGAKVFESKRGKRIGKVHHFIFHPSKRCCIGFTVKRPDAALMFHRKDLFVALGGFRMEDGDVFVGDDPDATDKGALKALGVDWDACVIWVGMPLMTRSGASLGYIDSVLFDRETGKVQSVSTENGLMNNAIVGKHVIPGEYVLGFKRNQGVSPADDGREEEPGAVLVSDEALEVPIEGGAAAAAGKATAVVANKAKKGAAKAKKTVVVQAEKAKPTVRKAAEKTGEAVESGTFAVGRQLGRASGMFSAFKEEFEKASKGDDR